MLEIVGKEETNYWEISDYENFPCQDMKILDHLWINYSQGRFGFSVKQRIYENIGGIIDGRIDSKLCEKFGVRLGWRSNNSWFYYNQLRFSLVGPIGQLPDFGVGQKRESQSQNHNNLDWERILIDALVGCGRFSENLLGKGEKNRGDLLVRGALFWVTFYNRTIIRCNLSSEEL